MTSTLRPPLARRRLFGLDFVADATIEQVAEAIEHECSTESTGWRCVVTPNVDHLVRYGTHPLEADVARDSFVVLPDGMPIVKVSGLLGAPLHDRLTGSDLFDALWPRLVASATPTVVVASSVEVATGLAHEHAALRCVLPPMFDVDEGDVVGALVDEISEVVAAQGTRALFIALSMPKHHLLAHRLHERWAGTDQPIPVVLLVGASPLFHLGLAPRAPRWMQRNGLEWLHRLVHEPRRLARRYLVDDMAFLGLAAREWRARRRGA